VPSPADRLDRAYREAADAAGADFFRRLRDYQRLLTNDRTIKRAVRRLRKRAEAADSAFVRADDGFVRELTTFRQQFARQVPAADDSDVPRPEASGSMAPVASAEAHQWAYTLANFDAIVAGKKPRLIIRQDLDHGRSGMLAAILDSKLVDLRWPPQNPAAGGLTRLKDDQRQDLEDLHKAVSDVRERERAAYRKAEDVLEQTGYLARARIAHTVAQLEPRSRVP
jgi:hypothetical protein